MPTAKLKIGGLRSAADETRLVASVREVTGVYGAVASQSERCLEVDFEDDEARVEEIVAAAAAAGFEASLVS